MSADLPNGRSSNLPRSKFAMVPVEVIESGLDSYCVHLYAYCDRQQGESKLTAFGAQYIADRIGWTPATVTVHARHLANAGLLAFTRVGMAKITYRIIHNPARKDLKNPEADLPPVVQRSRKLSKAESTFAPRPSRSFNPRQTTYGTLVKHGLERSDRPAHDGGRPRSQVGVELGEVIREGKEWISDAASHERRKQSHMRLALLDADSLCGICGLSLIAPASEDGCDCPL